jgi:hypothetical protein
LNRKIVFIFFFFFFILFGNLYFFGKFTHTPRGFNPQPYPPPYLMGEEVPFELELIGKMEGLIEYWFLRSGRRNTLMWSKSYCLNQYQITILFCWRLEVWLRENPDLNLKTCG